MAFIGALVALGVNLDTVQRAYRLLADEGVVASRVGRGKRIVDTPPLSLLDLDREVEVLVARARSAGVSTPELLALVRRVAARG